MIYEEEIKLLEEKIQECGWSMIPAEDRKRKFVGVLAGELAPSDPFLTGELYSVCRCDMNDDVLFLSCPEEGKSVWRIYHLTYTGSFHEGYPRYKEFGGAAEAAEYIKGNSME